MHHKYYKKIISHLMDRNKGLDPSPNDGVEGTGANRKLTNTAPGSIIFLWHIKRYFPGRRRFVG